VKTDLRLALAFGSDTTTEFSPGPASIVLKWRLQGSEREEQGFAKVKNHLSLSKIIYHQLIPTEIYA
jgi:hypothetical protein